MTELSGPRWGPASGGPANGLVVICHGLGADGADLIGLASAWGENLPHIAFSAPDAPFTHESGFGRQWWSVMDRTPSVMEAGVRSAFPYLDRYIDAELARLNLPADRYALAGFSQGAMMVLFAGFRRAVPPLAILAYSGALLAPQALLGEMRHKPPVLIVHGEQDDVVLPQRSQEAEGTLRDAGVAVELHYIPGLPHGIDDTGVALGAAFLRRAFTTGV